MVRTVLTKVSADLTKVRETFTMVREVLSMVRESLPNAFLLFSLKTRVVRSVESGVDRGDWMEYKVIYCGMWDLLRK
jgi:hypothetical protein